MHDDMTTQVHEFLRVSPPLGEFASKPSLDEELPHEELSPDKLLEFLNDNPSTENDRVYATI